MNSQLRRIRILFLSIAAVVAQFAKLSADRLLGRKPIEPMNYTLIETGLYLGGFCLNPPPMTRAVLNLSPNRDRYKADVMQWQPLHASSLPTLSWLRRQVTFIDKQRRAGLTVFVHCDAGIDRSAMVLAAYYMWRDRRSRDDALDFVQRKRAIVRPNPVFLQLLGDWERSLALAEPKERLPHEDHA